MSSAAFPPVDKQGFWTGTKEKWVLMCATFPHHHLVTHKQMGKGWPFPGQGTKLTDNPEGSGRSQAFIVCGPPLGWAPPSL